MTNRVIYQRKDYSLHERLPLPRDARHHAVDGHHLFVSPAKAAYVVADDAGEAAMRRLLAGATLGEVLRQVGPEVGWSDEEVQRSLRWLLVQMERNGFLADAEVIEDEMTNAPVLCYLTNRCNLTCTHCYQEAGPTVAVDRDISAQRWAEVFAGYGAFLATLDGLPGKITLSGGETMVRRDFFQILEAAARHDALVEVFTNGTLIRDEAIAERLAEHADIVQVSLDGASPDVNDAIRGRGTHRKILRALKLLAPTDLHLRIAVTVMPCNAQDVSDNLIPVVEEIGPGRIEIRIGLANVQGRADAWARFKDTVEGERVLRDMLEKLYRKGMRRPREIKPNFRQVSCGFGRGLTVANDGSVYGCAIQSYPLGNVLETPFQTLAERAYHLGRDVEVDRLDVCRDCDVRYFCNGGCRLNNLYRLGDLGHTACTADKRHELMRKLVQRELTGDPLLVAAEARISGFWAEA